VSAAGFPDHFSVVAAQYASARPEYPAKLFAWIAEIVPVRGRVWEAGCGSGQASRGLAEVFDDVFATDPSAAQIAQAGCVDDSRSDGVRFAVEPAERCSLPDASVDAVCVAQALHWFDRSAFFAECTRVLKPGGVLVVWGYQDIDVPEPLREAVGELSARIRDAWPTERFLVDRAYADFEFPFEAFAVDGLPVREIVVEWPLMRLLEYFSSYSAVKRYREVHGIDPVAAHARAIAEAWGDSSATHRLHWPLFAHARRKH
jgi:SAM-dependent methyltransferase